LTEEICTKKFVWKFMRELDGYIKKNISSIKCNDIFNMYQNFLDITNEFRGNSNGFTGYSELLLFRTIYHLLDADFKREKYHESGLYFFVSKKKKIWIGQNIGIEVGASRRKYPDIVVGDMTNGIQGIIQVKIYFTYGRKGVQSEIELLKEFKTKYPNMKSIIILYYHPSPKRNKSVVLDALNEYKGTLSWFDYCILQNNSETIGSILSRII